VTDTPSRVEVRTGPEGPVVHVAGRPLTGPDAAASVRRRLTSSGDDSPEQTLYILASPLHAPPLKEWMATLPRASGVLIVELDPELAALPGTAPHRAFGPTVETATTPGDARSKAWTLIRSRALRRVRMIGLSGGTRLHRAAYSRLEADVAALVQRFWNNRAAEIRLHRRWTANLFRNLALPGRPVHHLRERLPTRGILVGAGPSLDAALPLLREFFPVERRVPGETTATAATAAASRADFALLAIDTALPSLAAAGIRPDLVFVMDGQLANAADFLPWRWDECIFVADASTHFSIPRRAAPDRLFWFVSRFSETGLFRDLSLSGLFEDVPIVPPRGSVAPAAVQVAVEHFGMTEITCLGVDFWYRLPRSHALMSSSDRPARRRGDRLHHRNGHDRALARPWVPVTLRDGTRMTGDAVLVEQALSMAETVGSVSASIFVVGEKGLEIGGVPRNLAELREEIEASRGDDGSADAEGGTEGGSAATARGSAATERGSAAAAPGAVGTARGSAAAARTTIPGGSHLEAMRTRRAALEHLRDRLLRQEAILADSARPLFLDSGLDFVIADLPQWPLMTLRRDWVELHRQRILRAVRDCRRRLDASILG
jgi:hypothetical protein